MASRLIQRLQAYRRATHEIMTALDPTPGRILDGPVDLDARQRKLLLDILRGHEAGIDREIQVWEHVSDG